MSVQLKKIADQVIVLTGASSGIGLTTARMASARGARLVLAARNERALRDLVDEFSRNGREALYVVADVANQEDVHGIAEAAMKRFGRIDTWINDAGIGLFGKILDVALEDSRRLFETNFWGVVHGSLEALRHFHERDGVYGHALINLGSEVSDRAIPELGMYSASKHAVKGFTDALRMEVEQDNMPISVTLVKPGATDTPFPQHAKNYLEEEPYLPAPVYAPEVVAEVILHCAKVPERDMFAAGSAKMNSVRGGLLPRLVDWIMEGSNFSNPRTSSLSTQSEDALFAPTSGGRQRSGTRDDAKEWSAYTQAAMHPFLTKSLLLGAGIGIGGLVYLAMKGNSESTEYGSR